MPPPPARPRLPSMREEAWAHRDPRAESEWPPAERSTKQMDLGDAVTPATVMALATRMNNAEADIRVLKAGETRISKLEASDLEEAKHRAVHQERERVAAIAKEQDGKRELVALQAEAQAKGARAGRIEGAVVTLILAALLGIGSWLGAHIFK